MMGIQGLNKTKKNWGGCHHLLLVYNATKLSTAYVVKSPVPSDGIFSKVKFFKNQFCKKKIGNN